MTNKEAIHALRHLYRNCSWNEITCEEYGCESCEDALSMAIEALQDTRGKANHVVAEIKVDTDEIMERLEQEWYKPNEWIPCSERLPETHKAGNSVSGIFMESKPVLVYGVPEYESEYSFNVVTYCDDLNGNTYWSTEMDAVTINEVTAWMPLPEPMRQED